MATDNDVLKDAIIGTEKEIFGDAFGKEELSLDESGDRSLEAMGDGLEGQIEPDDGEETEVEETTAETKEDTEAAAKVEAEAKPSHEATEAKTETQGRVPAGRLREEAEARRKVEAERDALKAQLLEEQVEKQRIRDLLTVNEDGWFAAKQQVERLLVAAQAVIDRWMTPSWKDAEPTAQVINALSNAVSAARKEGK
jgi:hypothetical protein